MRAARIASGAHGSATRLKPYHPLLGSGTTLIVAERHARACYGLEVDPTYCDVILARWERFSGRAAERVDEREVAA